MGFLNIIIPFIILISIVVFVHEYGHYYYARKYGVKVTDFSIGFGKELFQLVLEKSYLVGQINMEHVGNYV